MQVRKQQLELDMEKQTGSKLGKGYQVQSLGLEDHLEKRMATHSDILV